MTTTTTRPVSYETFIRSALDQNLNVTEAMIRGAEATEEDGRIYTATLTFRRIAAHYAGAPTTYSKATGKHLSQCQAYNRTGVMISRVGDKVTLPQARAAFRLSQHKATRSNDGLLSALTAANNGEAPGVEVTGQAFGRILVRAWAQVQEASKGAQAAAPDSGAAEGSGEGSGEAAPVVRTPSERLQDAIKVLRPVVRSIQDGTADEDVAQAFRRMLVDMTKAQKAWDRKHPQAVDAPEPVVSAGDGEAAAA
jgi:hypothetical protein